MSEMQPQLEPGDYLESRTGDSAEMSMPGMVPPGELEMEDGRDVVGIGGPAVVPQGMEDSAPSLLPAEEGVAQVSAWQNNKKISGLWSINQNRNSWVHVVGIGWKKLANNSDTAIVALTMLGAHAREKGSVVHYREESDGMIREMYVW